MSRIGNKVVSIPSGVRVSLREGGLTFVGGRGELQLPLQEGVFVQLSDEELRFGRDGEGAELRARHGLMRALARNMIEGVSVGFAKRLEIQGIGFRAEVKGEVLVLNLGYSHLVEFLIPSDVKVFVDKDGKIVVSGADRGRVGQVAADIRCFRVPDRYKGKGIRYAGEKIALKEGKSA